MAFAISKPVSLTALLQSVKWQEVRCTDPYHDHKAPVLYACAVNYQGHRVSVVQDWDCYSVQIDGHESREDVSYQEVLQFVEKEVKES